MNEGPGGCTDLVEIGRGGFSVVYRGYQPQFDRIVAIKVLTVDALDQDARRRFRRECALTGRLTGHPNILTVFESGFADGQPFIIMEFFERGSLADLLTDHGPLRVEDVLQAGIKLAGALETAHRSNIVHRDVKPGNVLLKRFPEIEPVLADFGISVVADASMSAVAFTPEHAPPELFEGNEPTNAGDIYSLGSTLWTLLAGRAPFQLDPGEGIWRFMQRVLDDPVPELPRSDVPAALIRVLEQALAKDTDERVASAAALGEALQLIQTEQGLPRTEMPLSLDSVPPTQTSGTHECPADGEESKTVERRQGDGHGTDAAAADSWARKTAGPVQGPAGSESRPILARPLAADGESHNTTARAVPSVPLPDETPMRLRRSRRTVALVVTGIAVLAVGGLVLVGVLSGDDNGPVPPANVRVARVSPTGVVVTWKAHAGNRYPTVIIQSATNASSQRSTIFPSEQASHTGHRVEGLDPKQGYCFEVGSLLSADEVEVGGRACIDQAA